MKALGADPGLGDATANSAEPSSLSRSLNEYQLLISFTKMPKGIGRDALWNMHLVGRVLANHW